MKMKISFILSLLILTILSCEDCDTMVETNQCPECTLVPNVGPCNAAFPRYYYDQEEGQCKQFIWGGCDGVVPFETLEECEACDC